jgi:hypothetical protein
MLVDPSESWLGLNQIDGVMAGLVPAIHVLLLQSEKTWMPATSAGMTA